MTAVAPLASITGWLDDYLRIRELAARLPRLQADLRSLREQKQDTREP